MDKGVIERVKLAVDDANYRGEQVIGLVILFPNGDYGIVWGTADEDRCKMHENNLRKGLQHETVTDLVGQPGDSLRSAKEVS